jgi:hypothetical protein
LVIPETTLPSIPTNPAAASVELSRQKENYISMISEKNILKQLSAHAYSILPPSRRRYRLLQVGGKGRDAAAAGHDLRNYFIANLVDVFIALGRSKMGLEGAHQRRSERCSSSRCIPR